MTVAEYLSRVLKQNRIDTVFGIPSYVGMGILEGFSNNGFKIILNMHEQNAAHMAEGYYYATGKVPILSVAIGPGITNAITGIANAYNESIPMIVIAARAYSKACGRNEYHANTGYGRSLDEKMLLKSCTKQTFYIDNLTHAPALIYDAIRTSVTGRPGPVFISIPPELQRMEINTDKILSLPNFSSSSTPNINPNDLKIVEKEFSKSTKPLIMFGKGITEKSYKGLEKILFENCPYFTSYGAKGKVPILPNYLGTIWYCNSAKIEAYFKEADLVLAIGEEFTNFTTRLFGDYFQDKKFIQICEYTEELGRCFNLEHGVACNADKLISNLRIEKKSWEIKIQDKTNEAYNTLNIIKKIARLAPENSVFFSDVGNAGYCAITDLNLSKNQKFYTTGKFGVCGWSLPASIGYSFGNPLRPVFSIIGDLSFNMNIQDLPNIKQLGTKNNILLFNNQIPQNIAQDQLIEAKKTIQWICH